MAESTKDSVLFQREGKPPVGELLPLALQHVVAAVVGIITPAIIVANTCGLTADEKTMLIQVSLVMAGLITLVQAHPLFNGKIGSGLPIIMGASFAYVPTLTSIGGSFGIGAIIGAELIGGLVAIVFGIFLKQIRKLFPPVVTGTVVFCIGLSLYTVAIGYMAGGKGSANFGSAQNWIVAIITLVACVYFGNFTKGVTKLGSLLFGMLVGYAVALCFGMVDFSDVASAGWFQLPSVMPFEVKFVPPAIASISIIYVVASVQAIGDFSGASMGGMDREPIDQELCRRHHLTGHPLDYRRCLRCPSDLDLWPECRHRHPDPCHQPQRLHDGSPDPHCSRPPAEVRCAPFRHPAGCHRRRYRECLRHDHDDGHQDPLAEGPDPAQCLDCWPLGRSWHGHRPHERLPCWFWHA